MSCHTTQHLSLSINNNLTEGTISLRNLICAHGQPYEKGETVKLISPEDVNQISIPHGKSAVLSVCGSATLGQGIEGMIDLRRDGKSLIASLYWNGPWKRIGNECYLVNVDNEHYVLELTTPPFEGILGDLAVDVREIEASEPLQ
ncbi:hypothetical protein N7471_001862 [Penicillium samsonianum]|uniref:uncharacterized protein n=1 Tax=Penicillium samsonianum TaxID=1882272 RepID=UPI0025499222|nr:uncharacterized protein N7471_001862 [Penicillium samsonianum]KAJ6150663.1 hypothetical protein N7471_001862 [Penicillium samsonianum]